MSKYGVHICAPYGKTGPKGELVPPGTECDRQGCGKPAKGYLGFPWGAVALCGPHLLEDMAPPRRHRGKR